MDLKMWHLALINRWGMNMILLFFCPCPKGRKEKNLPFPYWAKTGSFFEYAEVESGRFLLEMFM